MTDQSNFCNKIQINSLEYKEPQANRSGGKVVHVSTVPGSTEWKDRIRFQMSEDQTKNLQTAVWGLGTPLPGQDTSRRTLELSVESPDLLKFLEEMDENNVKKALENSPVWFKKNVEESSVRQMYVKMVKEPVKPGAPSTVRVKVKCGDYPTNIYLVQREENGTLTYTRGVPEDLTRNVKCLVMAETVGLWFMSRQFGMSLTATEILVWPNKRATGIDAFTLTNSVVVQKYSESKIIPDADVEMED